MRNTLRRLIYNRWYVGACISIVGAFRFYVCVDAGGVHVEKLDLVDATCVFRFGM